MNFRLELAKFEFGFLHTENLPDLAATALEEGLDSPSLRILAGLSKIMTDEIRDYWRRVIKELAIECPSREQAAWILIRYFIEQIISKEIDPHDGIHVIINDIYHKMDWNGKKVKYVGDPIGIHELYGLCVTFDDLAMSSHRWDKKKSNAELLAELKAEIVEASKEYRRYLSQQFPAQGGPIGRL